MVINGQTEMETSEIIAIPLPVALIDPYRLNRRCADTDADIAELARTIVESGLLAPISARPIDGGRYEIICGERRWRAYRLLQRETIPCIVKMIDATQAQIERIIENYQRRDPTFIEQGEAVAALLELTGSDVSEVANRLGQSQTWVRRRAKLPNLIPAWREELEKENTPYFAIRDSVDKLEELAALPPATQQTTLDSNALRYIKTTKEMRNIIAKLFMDLGAKPWTRTWERAEYSGSGKKRCDACMKRSDRESALFADPDAIGKGKVMCLDPQCWKERCLAWSRSLIHDKPGMVPIRHEYYAHGDDLGEYFGVEPVRRFDWQERNGAATVREGYTAAIGVIIDGPEIGVTKSIWLEQQDVNDADGEDDDAGIDQWQEANVTQHQLRQALANIIASDITAYLADIDSNAAIPTVVLTDRKLRTMAWFGIFGYADSEEENAALDDPDWNPLAWAWEQTAGYIAEHVASIAAEDIAQIYNADRDHTAGHTFAATLTNMFAIPLDTITTRAAEALHTLTEGADRDEADAAILSVDVEALTDAGDCLPVETIPYLPMLAEAQ